MKVQNGRQVDFEVSYRLGEYLAFLQDELDAHLRAGAAAKGEPVSRRDLWLGRAGLMLIGTIGFFYKVARVGTCRFIIDRDTIVRDSRSGRFVVPWSQIVAVKRFRRGYLLDKGTGAMPVPYRALTKQQLDILEGIVVAWEAGALPA